MKKVILRNRATEHDGKNQEAGESEYNPPRSKVSLPLLNHYNEVSGYGSFGLAEEDVAGVAEAVNYLAASCS